MDTRDDTHTQVRDLIETLRIIAKQKPPSELVWGEITRWAEQAATIVETYILTTIKVETPYLDLRTGVLGNAHKIAPLVVGATSQEAADADIPGSEEGAVAANAFMPPNRNGARS
jgi:hypothetical protein